MTLWHAWSCPYCVRVRIALAEKGVAYDEREIDLGSKPPELLALNPPGGGVPVLVDGSTVVAGSLEILDWIETRFPEPPLQPRDAVGRDQARAMYERVNRLMPLVPRILRGAPEEQDPARRAARAALEDLEGEAPAEGFLLGDLSIADLALASFVMKLPLNLRPSALGLPFLSRWEAAIAARPSVAHHAALRRAA